jgi:uncharacterized protein
MRAMATERGKPTRRELLLGLGALVAAPAAPARADDGLLYLGARNDAAGEPHVSGFDGTGAPRLDLPLAGRGHAFAVHPRRPEAVLFARRPGRTALVVDLERGRPLATIDAAPGRHFCGHGAYIREGALLCATEETDEAGRGRVGRYDPAQGYRRIGESPSYGVGPHEMAVLADGQTLVVANGGIVTDADAPGVKLERDRMRPSLALIDARDGRLLTEACLAEPLWRLSLRHLAIGRGDVIAVAAQDEGDVADLLPLAAVWRGRAGLEMLDAGPSVTTRMRGYCGAAAMDTGGTLLGISCPRGGVAVFWDLATARVLGTVDLPDGCGIASDAAGEFLLSSGRGGVVRVALPECRVTPLPAGFVARARWDNHLAVGRLGGAGG